MLDDLGKGWARETGHSWPMGLCWSKTGGPWQYLRATDQTILRKFGVVKAFHAADGVLYFGLETALLGLMF